jgi:hypothetical protein
MVGRGRGNEILDPSTAFDVPRFGPRSQSDPFTSSSSADPLINADDNDDFSLIRPRTTRASTRAPPQTPTDSRSRDREGLGPSLARARARGRTRTPPAFQHPELASPSLQPLPARRRRSVTPHPLSTSTPQGDSFDRPEHEIQDSDQFRANTPVRSRRGTGHRPDPSVLSNHTPALRRTRRGLGLRNRTSIGNGEGSFSAQFRADLVDSFVTRREESGNQVTSATHTRDSAVDNGEGPSNSQRRSVINHSPAMTPRRRSRESLLNNGGRTGTHDGGGRTSIADSGISPTSSTRLPQQQPWYQENIDLDLEGPEERQRLLDLLNTIDILCRRTPRSQIYNTDNGEGPSRPPTQNERLLNMADLEGLPGFMRLAENGEGILATDRLRPDPIDDGFPPLTRQPAFRRDPYVPLHLQQPGRPDRYLRHNALLRSSPFPPSHAKVTPTSGIRGSPSDRGSHSRGRGSRGSIRRLSTETVPLTNDIGEIIANTRSQIRGSIATRGMSLPPDYTRIPPTMSELRELFFDDPSGRTAINSIVRGLHLDNAIVHGTRQQNTDAVELVATTLGAAIGRRAAGHVVRGYMSGLIFALDTGGAVPRVIAGRVSNPFMGAELGTVGFGYTEDGELLDFDTPVYNADRPPSYRSPPRSRSLKSRSSSRRSGESNPRSRSDSNASRSQSARSSLHYVTSPRPISSHQVQDGETQLGDEDEEMPDIEPLPNRHVDMSIGISTPALASELPTFVRHRTDRTVTGVRNNLRGVAQGVRNQLRELAETSRRLARSAQRRYTRAPRDDGEEEYASYPHATNPRKRKRNSQV